MHSSKVSATQLVQDNQVVGVRLGCSDCVEDSNELASCLLDSGNDLLCNGWVLVVKDFSCTAALAKVEIVCAGNGNHVYACGCGYLGRHGPDGGGTAVDDDGLAERLNRGVEGGIWQGKGRG